MAGDGGFGSRTDWCVKSSRIGTTGFKGACVATAGKSPKDRAAREERDRARLYQARNEFHGAVERRRVRDNVIAGVAGGLLVVVILGGQIAYYAAGPGAPQPTPVDSPQPTDAPSPSATPSATVSPTP